MVNAQMDEEHSVEPSVGANAVASEILGDSTQKLPGQSPSNAKMAAATTEISTAIPSVCHPLSTLVGLGTNVNASEISGDSTQKLPGQSPKNAKMAFATTEITTATPSDCLPPSTLVGANVDA